MLERTRRRREDQKEAAERTDHYGQLLRPLAFESTSEGLDQYSENTFQVILAANFGQPWLVPLYSGSVC